MSVAHDSLPSAVVDEVLVGGQVRCDLGLHGLREQALGTRAQDVCERVRGPGRSLVHRDHGRI